MHRISVATRPDFNIAINGYRGLCALLRHRTIIGFPKDRFIRRCPAFWNTVHAA